MDGSQLSGKDLMSTPIDQECNNRLVIIVKSINMSGCVDKVDAERRIAKFMNLPHPCISIVIGSS
jgi:hypothetical protein